MPSPGDFQPAVPRDLRLAPREVELWSVDLAPPPAVVERLRRLLSRDEDERVRRYRFEIHRRRGIVRRGVLRLLLGAYLGRDPAALEFDYGEKGKPILPGARLAGEELHFNLSDSEDLGLYGFARGLEIGVDVEMLRQMDDAESIAESFFSREERDELRAVPAAETSRAFLNCWTRKEAYIKAIGEGLSEPLGRFRVTLVPGEPARFVHLGGDRERAARWTLTHLVPTTGSVGAVAYASRRWTLGRCFRLLHGGGF